MNTYKSPVTFTFKNNADGPAINVADETTNQDYSLTSGFKAYMGAMTWSVGSGTPNASDYANKYTMNCNYWVSPSDNNGNYGTQPNININTANLSGMVQMIGTDDERSLAHLDDVQSSLVPEAGVYLEVAIVANQNDSTVTLYTGKNAPGE